MNRSLSQKGSSTIEILIAFAILVLALSAVVIVVFGSQNLAIDTQINSDAIYRAQSMLEEARALSRKDFDSVSSSGTTVEYSGGLAFSKKLDVTDLDLFTKQATSTVTWTMGGRTLSVELSTLLTDPSNVLGGDTCSATVSGDWTNPQRLGYGDIVSSEGASGLDAFNHKVFLTTKPSASAKDDLFIFDVSDPDPAGGSLPILGSLNIGDGLEDVRVAGRFAYVVPASSSTAQLMVIDTIDTANPKGVAWLDTTASGITGYGNTLTYADGYVYLGLTKSTGAELKVISVSDPLHPSVVGSLETDTAVNQVLIDRDNDLAYLALAATSTGQLWKVDISNPASPVVLQKFFPGSAYWVGQSVALSDTGNVFLGRYRDLGGNDVDLYSLNSSNIAGGPLGTVMQTKDDGFTRMVVRSGYLFASNVQANLGFQVWDVTDPTDMTLYGSLNIQQASTAGMDCEGNYIFIGQRSNQALQIVGPYTTQPFVFTLANSGDVSVDQSSSVTDTITVTKTSGAAASVPLSVSFSPAATGLSGTFSPTSCTPNTTCTSTLTITTTGATPSGTYAVTVTSGTVTTTFNVTVNVPFAYTLSASPSTLSFTKVAPGTETITITKTAGTAQAVTLSFSSIGSITVTPQSGTSCTPSSGSCQLKYTISTNSSGHKTGTYTVTGSPNSVTTTFNIVAN